MTLKNDTLTLSWSVLVGANTKQPESGCQVVVSVRWSQSWFCFFTVWQQMLFFDDNKGSKPSREGCDGAPTSEDAWLELSPRLGVTSVECPVSDKWSFLELKTCKNVWYSGIACLVSILKVKQVKMVWNNDKTKPLISVCSPFVKILKHHKDEWEIWKHR